MKCDFSETQFAFCFTFEILQKYFPREIVPHFPNTVEEGRSGGGYDVSIDGSLFLQFKVPVYLKKGKYKIKIHTEDEQFRLLKELNRPANLVYYSAPKFHTREDIENFYIKKQIENNSALFSIKNFPEDGAYHNLKYEYKDDNHSYGILSSEPKEIETLSNIFSIPYHPYQMLLSEKADFLLEIIKKFDYNLCDSKVDNNIDRVFSILLNRYNILWIPLKQKSCLIPLTR